MYDDCVVKLLLCRLSSIPIEKVVVAEVGQR